MRIRLFIGGAIALTVHTNACRIAKSAIHPAPGVLARHARVRAQTECEGKADDAQEE